MFSLVTNQGDTLFPDGEAKPTAPEPGEDCFVIEWNLQNGTPLAVFGVKYFDEELVPDTRTKMILLPGADEQEARKLQVTLPDKRVLDFRVRFLERQAVSPDGTRTAAVEGTRITIRSAEDEEVLFELPLGNQIGSATGVSWTGDGSILAVAFSGNESDKIGCMILDGRPHQGSGLQPSALHDFPKLIKGRTGKKAQEASARRWARILASTFQGGAAAGVVWAPEPFADAASAARCVIQGGKPETGPFRGEKFQAILAESELKDALPFLEYDPDLGLTVKESRSDKSKEEPKERLLQNEIPEVQTLRSTPESSLPPPASESTGSKPVSIYPAATPGSRAGRVNSPYPPYNELDVSGLKSGDFAIDPTTNKIFQVP